MNNFRLHIYILKNSFSTKKKDQIFFSFLEETDVNIFWRDRKQLTKSRKYGKSVAKSMIKEFKRILKLFRTLYKKSRLQVH